MYHLFIINLQMIPNEQFIAGLDEAVAVAVVVPVPDASARRRDANFFHPRSRIWFRYFGVVNV